MKGYCDPDYDPDVSIKSLVLKLGLIGVISCGLLYAVGLVIV